MGVALEFSSRHWFWYLDFVGRAELVADYPRECSSTGDSSLVAMPTGYATSADEHKHPKAYSSNRCAIAHFRADCLSWLCGIFRLGMD